MGPEVAPEGLRLSEFLDIRRMKAVRLLALRIGHFYSQEIYCAQKD